MNGGEVCPLVPVRDVPYGSVFFYYGYYCMNIDTEEIGVDPDDFAIVVNMQDGVASRMSLDVQVRLMSRAELHPEGSNR